ncbi:MAG: hypothetical protein IAE81_16805 [Caldilineaceae bacterium]|jgi:hypothetical protein|nr:hypothetical protein [Caldilineaceae bacterium]
MIIPSPAELQRRELETQYALLVKQHAAASQQLQTTLNAANRPLLEAQVAELAARVAAVWERLNALEPAPPAALRITIRPRMEQVYTALCDLFDPEARPLVEVELANATAQPRRLLVSSHIQEYSHRAETTVPLAAGATTTVRHLPALRKLAVQGLSELTRAMLSVAVTDLDTGRVVQQESVHIVLLARNAAPIAARDPATNAWIDLTRYLAAFVTPNAEAVLETLRQAVDRHPERRLAGYQADVALQVNALYDVLKYDLGIAYIDARTSFNHDAAALDQRVRLPSETLRLRSANCIDGVLLFASLLEACTLSPALLLSHNHALVGWETWPDSGVWEYLETTVFSTNDFAEARELGRRKAAFLQEQAARTGDATWFRRWPVKTLRTQHHITPLE